MKARPISPQALLGRLADRVCALPGWVRVGVDGPEAAGADRWADELAEVVRVRGRAVMRVRTADFLRPRSLRLEQGRTNPDAYYEDWLDLDGLRREVLEPLAPGGSGRVLPTLRDPVTDRATRAAYRDLAPGGVLLLSGPLLLGAGLPFELTVHLELSAAALARRTPDADAWTLPAFERYVAEVDPALLADVVVRVDDPRHPALRV